MAGNDVSLSEITSVKGDPDLAYGSPAGGTDAVVPFSKGIDYLTQAARDKQEATKFKYLEFKKNQEDYYKNFNTLDVNGLMPGDYPQISQEYAKLVGDLATHLDVIGNPNKNIDLYQSLQQREATLRSKIAQSKMDKAYAIQNESFMKANPDLLTSDNKAQTNDFYNKPLGQRNYFTLNLPFVYDPTMRAKIANTVAQQKYTEQKVKGKFITDEEGVRYLTDEYDKAWDALGASTDKSGRTVYDAAKDAYSKLPPEITHGQDFKSIDRNVGRSLLYQDENFKKLQANPVAMQDDQQAFEASQQNKRLAFERWKSLLDKPKDVDAGKIYNFALTSGFTNGYVPVDFLQNIYGNNDKITLKSGSKKLDPTNPLNTTEVTNEQQVPKIQVTRSEKDKDGNLVYYYVDNSKDPTQEIASDPITIDQARVAFENILGPKEAGKVAKEEQQYRKLNKLPFNYDLPSLQEHFKFNAPPIAAPSSIPTGYLKTDYGGKTYYVSPDTKIVLDENGKAVPFKK